MIILNKIARSDPNYKYYYKIPKNTPIITIITPIITSIILTDLKVFPLTHKVLTSDYGCVIYKPEAKNTTN